jgi:Carboxypeptidase regulatory-like domain
MKFLWLLIAALSIAPTVFAQKATLRGQVTDETGAIVPKATVTLTGTKGQVFVAITDDRGMYIFPGAPPGDYFVTGSAPELITPEPIKLSLKAGTTTTLNLQLKVLATAQHVTVEEAAGPAVSTEASSNASAVVLRGEDLQALSDDPEDLMTDLQALAGPSAGPNGGSIFIDGFSGGELPAKESIREVRVNQNPFSPEYDKLGLGRIEIFTKPGTDRYHGTMNYNFADDVWNSRNPYSAEKAPLVLNELEGNMGGPLGKRTSFTLDAQRNTVDDGAIINAVIVDPQTLAIQPLLSTYTVPQRFTRLSPRIDRQLNEENTLMFRYSVTHSDIHGTGIGSFNLSSSGYDYSYLNQLAQATETAVLGSSINETRFQYFRSAIQRNPYAVTPSIEVLNSFVSGGAQMGYSPDTQNNFELQNYTTISKGAHVWKFGARLREQSEDSVSRNNFNGTFVFGGSADLSSIELYQRTLAGAPGAGPTQFVITTGAPELRLRQLDLGAFAGDDWRARPNLTLSYGLRYETQTNIHDWLDFAPRVAVAWAPAAGGKNPKTVLRAGFGTFYDRFPLFDVLSARRFNGIVQQKYVITNPDFFPNVPSLAGLQSTQVIQKLSSSLRAPYYLQGTVTVEHQLPANSTLAVTYGISHGLHMLRSEDINAPLAGTYHPAIPGSGVFPLHQANPVFLAESSGLYNQNQLIVNVNTRVNSGLSLFGFYVFNKAQSNTDGIGTFPANPYSFAGEYGPASTDIRHRFTLGGSINTRWNVRLSPYVTMQSGAPFDITTGSDLYGTTLFNGRPGFATDPTKPGLIPTAYGLLDPNPTPGERLVPRNYGRGPAQIALNLRLSKTFGFGGEKADAKSGKGSAGGPSASIANPALARGGGAAMRSIIGLPTTNRRYNLVVGMVARNVLNHTNPGPIIGDITSPFFGQANQMAGNLNGEGFSENADNRRLELQLRFQF